MDSALGGAGGLGKSHVGVSMRGVVTRGRGLPRRTGHDHTRGQKTELESVVMEYASAFVGQHTCGSVPCVVVGLE